MAIILTAVLDAAAKTLTMTPAMAGGEAATFTFTNGVTTYEKLAVWALSCIAEVQKKHNEAFPGNPKSNISLAFTPTGTNLATGSFSLPLVDIDPTVEGVNLEVGEAILDAS